ncbi:MAG: cupin-like domain-containing protein [Archangium sp.]|nr:cupin-like domain-containing protein [Archangium sp.]
MAVVLDPLSKTWLAEAWARGFSLEELVAANPFADVTPAQLARGLRALERSPDAEVIRTLSFRLARMEWQARIRRTFGGRPRLPSVARLSRRDFLERHYAPQRPVRLTSMMRDWRALKRWTPAFFREHFGEVPVKVAQGRDQTPFYDLNVHHISGEVPFGQYVDWVERTRRSNQAYLVANNNGLSGPLRALVKDVGFFGGLMDRRRIDGFVYLWYGPGGTVTPLHHDTTNILFCQVRGRKRVTLIDPAWTELVRDCVSFYSLVDVERPDARRFPYFAGIPKLTVTLGPGECLFIPAGGGTSCARSR